ncbi:hypothetical protein BJ508DRAFT_329650 [Ascobolus immersus RN42]|uniref:Uncharacterized protein n=1 Tax=Ascobolus immersus RN42 TaxID=1160509 RepID=A0A3N4HVW4_ASCIM|nr:hypothetical protein BJ508DRAFT_329650 [Ascobolus immersus RN42]
MDNSSSTSLSLTKEMHSILMTAKKFTHQKQFRPNIFDYDDYVSQFFKYTIDILSQYQYYIERGDLPYILCERTIATYKDQLASWGSPLSIEAAFVDEVLLNEETGGRHQCLVWTIASLAERIIHWFEEVQPPGSTPLDFRRQFRSLIDNYLPVVDKKDIEYEDFTDLAKGKWEDGQYPQPLRGAEARIRAWQLFKRVEFLVRVLMAHRELIEAWIAVYEGRMTVDDAWRVRVDFGPLFKYDL